jgi:DMSO/TMAO reductase YedYZ heme-binding membrane subunit
MGTAIIVGIVLGVIGLVGMVLAVVLLFKWWKKRNQNTYWKPFQTS